MPTASRETVLTDQLLEKLLLAVIAGSFSLVPGIVQLVSARSQAKGRSDEVARLGAELEFLTRLDALSRAASASAGEARSAESPVNVQSDLARLLSDYRAMRPKVPEEHHRYGALSFAARLLLLFRPHTHQGWAIHTVFYFLVIFVVVGLLTNLQSPTFDPKTGENEFRYLVIGLAVLVGPPLFLLRRAALRHRERALEARAAAHPAAAG
jgi:hypothetical protein